MLITIRICLFCLPQDCLWLSDVLLGQGKKNASERRAVAFYRVNNCGSRGTLLKMMRSSVRWFTRAPDPGGLALMFYLWGWRSDSSWSLEVAPVPCRDLRERLKKCCWHIDEWFPRPEINKASNITRLLKKIFTRWTADHGLQRNKHSLSNIVDDTGH